ncbi:hypothetical protein [Comamonas testosteroni]|uniref:hypothetical protein n=1 Tax=Comamonas testosteroni TaxID=285 RepID=UPI0026EED8CB|nr:hypothetical protein [Comamonas testosteroni]WQD45384.1 hypothetical protein U0024_11775 [Comamonas testosteroni]
MLYFDSIFALQMRPGLASARVHPGSPVGGRDKLIKTTHSLQQPEFYEYVWLLAKKHMTVQRKQRRVEE